MNDNKILFDMMKEHKWQDFTQYLNKHEDLDVNIRDNSNNYLIQIAVLYNNKDIVSLLINRGAKLDILDSDGRSLLYLTIKYNYLEILKLLLYFNKSSIGVSLVDMTDKSGHIPLHTAIILNNMTAMTLLLENGSNINFPDKLGNTALHLSVYTKNIEMLQLVLKWSPNINARSLNGESALHIACNLELFSIVELLINHKIDVNIQDYDNEIAPLIYTISLNNFKLTKLLVDSGANLGLQDSYGNTAFHYTVIEDNIEIFKYMFETLKTHKIKIHKIVNISNVDGKTCTFLVLENLELAESKRDEYLKMLLPENDLTIQDVNGTTVLHLLMPYWKSYQDILMNKTLDINLKNKEGKTPVDYLKDTEKKQFMDLVADSYYNRLRKQTGWPLTWQNDCSKNKQKCMEEIKKIISTKSYPQKKDDLEIKFEEYPFLEVGTFTGVTLDVLIGLIYLLGKHKNQVCNILTKEFINHEEISQYYKSLNIENDPRGEYLNFEIIWAFQKLFFMTSFTSQMKKCQSSEKRFVIIPLAIELKLGGHSNYLIYDKKLKEIERFEPNGSQAPSRFNYNASLLDHLLKKKFIEIEPNIKYFSPSDYLPKIGFQLLDATEQKYKRIGDPGGFCAPWTIWYTDLRLSNPDIKREVLIKKTIRMMRKQLSSFKNSIRNYSGQIISLRDGILKPAKLDINNWLNDSYTDKQLSVVNNQLKAVIDQL